MAFRTMQRAHASHPCARKMVCIVVVVAVTQLVAIPINAFAPLHHQCSQWKTHSLTLGDAWHHDVSLKLFLDDKVSLHTNQTSPTRENDVQTFSNVNYNDTEEISTAESTPKPAIHRGNFGDIMSQTVDDADVLFQDGLVTSECYSLAKVYGIHHPLDRMAVTANGNLQRLFSSYYDAPIQVVVDFCHPVADQPRQWKRRVQLQLYCKNPEGVLAGGEKGYYRTFCVADSTVQVHTPECQALVESGQVGLGQLFRYWNLLPEFALQSAAPNPPVGDDDEDIGEVVDSSSNSNVDTGFWRRYTLDCPGVVTCEIHETFIPGVWNLQPQADSPNGDPCNIA